MDKQCQNKHNKKLINSLYNLFHFQFLVCISLSRTPLRDFLLSGGPDMWLQLNPAFIFSSIIFTPIYTLSTPELQLILDTLTSLFSLLPLPNTTCILWITSEFSHYFLLGPRSKLLLQWALQIKSQWAVHLSGCRISIAPWVHNSPWSMNSLLCSHPDPPSLRVNKK